LLGSSRKTAGGLLSSEPQQQCLKVAHCEFHATPLAASATAHLRKFSFPEPSEEVRSGVLSSIWFWAFSSHGAWPSA